MLCCPSEKVTPEIAVDDSPVVDEVIGKANDVPNGTKKTFEVHGRKILVINDGGKYFAVNGLCAHYGVPLEGGVYANGRIRCPAHGACFNVRTGDIEDFPSFGNLHAFEVTNVNGDLRIHTTEKRLCKDSRQKKPPKVTLSSMDPIIVIGSGPAAERFIESARNNGVSTPIIVVTDEAHPPYDRVRMSKKTSFKIEDLRLQPDEYYKENKIDFKLNTRVESVTPGTREIHFHHGDKMKYSKLVIATGGTVRKLVIPGAHLENVLYLRKVEDVNAIDKAAPGKRIVCIGASFIGMEVASALASTAESVTVVSSSPEPLPVFHQEIGKAVRQKFEEKGIKFVTGTSPISLEGETRVKRVHLENGISLDTDVVIAGIGVTPSTLFLKGSGIELDSRGFVVVDKNFKTNADDVYAIGDVTTAPLPEWQIDSINIQHFQTAQTHGDLLGFAMANKPFPRPIVPFFWSLFFFTFGVKMAGNPTGHDEVIIHGKMADLNFAQYFIKKNRVIAIASAGPMNAAITFLELCSQRRKLMKSDIEKRPNGDLSDLLQSP